MLNSEEKKIILTTKDQKGEYEKIFEVDQIIYQSNQILYDEIYNNNFNENQSIITIAYGCTNSGKTFTILGNNEKQGLIQLLYKSVTENFKNDDP